MLSNTDWAAGVPFILFMQNAVQYLAGELTAGGRRSVRPGETVTLAVPGNADELRVRRPDGQEDRVAAGDATVAHFGRTDVVGVYDVTPSPPERGAFAVNLFSAHESLIAPAPELTLGAQRVPAKAEAVEINQPAWRYLLLGLLGLLLLEWVVYNQRIFV